MADERTPSAKVWNTATQHHVLEPYASRHSREFTPHMSNDSACFLHTKADVPYVFLQDLEQAKYIWDIDSFISWYSNGSRFEIAKHFGFDFCSKYYIPIIKLAALFHFVQSNTCLQRNLACGISLDTSFPREEWWYFLQEHRATIHQR